jgi:putative ABC transport system ATP-binding protein
MAALIELRNVLKTFSMGERDVEILHGIGVTVEEGEFVALMGPSGSGKTTTLEILGALSRPTSGTYHFDGIPVHELDDDELADLRAARMGFVFQTFNLMPHMSAVRNVALPLVYGGVPRREREERAAELLQQLGLGHRLDHRPNQLSGGERQRVAIARSLANDPRVIFADEPTGNLDEANSREIMALFRALHRGGRTFIVVTHSPEVAAFADRILEIRDGSIVRGHGPA